MKRVRIASTTLGSSRMQVAIIVIHGLYIARFTRTECGMSSNGSYGMSLTSPSGPSVFFLLPTSRMKGLGNLGYTRRTRVDGCPESLKSEVGRGEQYPTTRTSYREGLKPSLSKLLDFFQHQSGKSLRLSELLDLRPALAKEY